MGTNIFTYSEVKNEETDTWRYVGAIFPDYWDHSNGRLTYNSGPFDRQSYGLFGFLANERNYSEVPFISEHRGLPDNLSTEVSEEYGDGDNYYYPSWLSVKELCEFNYDQVFWDRRITKNGNGAATAEEGEGRYLTVREFLGEAFFKDLELLKELGESEKVRVVFWFSI